MVPTYKISNVNYSNITNCVILKKTGKLKYFHFIYNICISMFTLIVINSIYSANIWFWSNFGLHCFKEKITSKSHKDHNNYQHATSKNSMWYSSQYFIENFAFIMTLITKLMQKEKSFEWTTKCQIAEETIKNWYANAPHWILNSRFISIDQIYLWA